MRSWNPIPPFKFKFFLREFKSKRPAILDVGCGPHSAALTKEYFPGAVYHGLDCTAQNPGPWDHQPMDRFYDKNLVTDSLGDIPENTYDLIFITHVVEHIPNGLAVLEQLPRKLRKGGRILVEFPSERSLSLPPMARYGLPLQFCDDTSHVRVYSIREVSNVLLAAGCAVERAGVRRNCLFAVVGLLVLPLIYLAGRILHKRIHGYGLWDLFGFADYVLATRK